MAEGGLERGPADETMIIETANGSALEETTRFTIRPLPLGGFVRIKGMLPEADGSETRIPGGFYSKPPWQRFIVLLAGPVFSVIAGCILIFLLFATVGKPLQSPKPVLGVVASGSPAEAAGLKAGDRILSIDAKPIATFYDMIVIVRDPANPHHTIVYQRAGQQYTTQVIAEPDKTTSVVLNSDLEDTDVYKKQAKIGAGPSDDFIYRRVPLGQAFSEAFSTPAKALAMLGKLVLTPARLADNVGGPITMISETRKAVAHGPADVIGLAGLLSISVGILNLLPIPPLDGGQMAIAVAEMFRRGRRLSMKVQNWAAASGFLIVALLMIFVLSIDVSRLGTQEKPKFSDRDKYTSPNK